MIASFKNRKCQMKWGIPFFFRCFQLYGHLFFARSFVRLIFFSLASCVVLFWSPVRNICRPVDLFRLLSSIALWYCVFFPFSVSKDVIKIHISHRPIRNGYKCHVHTSRHMWTRFFLSSSSFSLFKVSHLYVLRLFFSVTTFDDRTEWRKAAQNCTRLCCVLDKH